VQFNNPQHALRWAYEALDRTGDLHAEATLLLSKCERALGQLHFSYIRVQFGREAGGFEMLGRHLAANFGAGQYRSRAIEQIIRAYCGERIGLREIRKSLNCGMLKAALLRNRGYDLLDAIHDQAMGILELELAGYFEKDVESV